MKVWSYVLVYTKLGGPNPEYGTVILINITRKNALGISINWSGWTESGIFCTGVGRKRAVSSYLLRN